MANDLTPDWILQQTLQVQDKAEMSFRAAHPDTFRQPDNGGLTLTVLGCGTMGLAILGGIMDSLASDQKDDISASAPKRLPTRFNTCVRSDRSAQRIRDELGKYPAFASTRIRQNDNIAALHEADVVLLGCKPYMVNDLLSSRDIQAALKGKLLLNICAGVTDEQLRSLLGHDTCTIVRVVPNTAAAIRESMTVIQVASPPLEPETATLVDWLFTRVGRVSHMPAANMDACSSLCGSGPAFSALMLDGLAAGGIAMGIPRDEAYAMAAQTMRGTTGLVLQGEHPAVLKDKVTTPGGCTIGGLLVLEEGAVKGCVAKAVREATGIAGLLGQGVQGVNGTRR